MRPLAKKGSLCKLGSKILNCSVVLKISFARSVPGTLGATYALIEAVFSRIKRALPNS